MVLEDAGETNAGFGSNLTESGTVEMDAGLMDGSSLLFGSVGAISGVKNPILVAQKLVEEQGKGLLPLGRVPPNFLVGGRMGRVTQHRDRESHQREGGRPQAARQGGTGQLLRLLGPEADTDRGREQQ